MRKHPIIEIVTISLVAFLLLFLAHYINAFTFINHEVYDSSSNEHLAYWKLLLQYSLGYIIIGLLPIQIILRFINQKVANLILVLLFTFFNYELSVNMSESLGVLVIIENLESLFFTIYIHLIYAVPAIILFAIFLFWYIKKEDKRLKIGVKVR